MFEHLPADRGFILLADPETKEWIAKVERARPGVRTENLFISKHIADEAIATRQAVLVRDAREDDRFESARSIKAIGIRSAICAPLCHEGCVGGLVYADKTSVDEAFTNTHLELLSILASLSAAAVERARLHEDIAQEKKISNAPGALSRARGYRADHTFR